uniref:Uncharacterized protein n=1 Tax=Romanomermis culicivorax TaxID=13658 RepID=A0A915LCW4_ROMCU
MKNQHNQTSSSSSHLPPILPQRSVSTAAAPVSSYFKESSDEFSSLSSSISRSKIDLSTAAKSHKLHKVPKVPTRCSHCDSYTFFQTIQCVECFMCWHKDCLKYTNLPCETTFNAVSAAGPSSINSSLTRRMSIFGVDLSTHLQNSKTDIPGVVAICIEELEKRGLSSLFKSRLTDKRMTAFVKNPKEYRQIRHYKCKGVIIILIRSRHCRHFDPKSNNFEKSNALLNTRILPTVNRIKFGFQANIFFQACFMANLKKRMGLYRVCGVKTKTEELCQQFENNSVADLSDIPSSNIASVIKLYLRQLPEPLFTHQLFADFMKIGEKLSDDRLSSFSDYYPDISLKLIIKKLPQVNYNLAKVLLLHLNRVTWFEKENQMSGTNLGIVFGPTLLWKKDGLNLVDLPLQNKVVETAIVYAYEIFDVNDVEDLKRFNLTRNPTVKDKHRSSRSLRLSHPLALNFEGTCSPEERASLASTMAEKLRRNKTVTPDLLKACTAYNLNICDLKIRKKSEDSHQSTASSKESVGTGPGIVDLNDQKPLLKASFRRKQAAVPAVAVSVAAENNGSKAAAAYCNEVAPEIDITGVASEMRRRSAISNTGSQDSDSGN